MNDLDEYIKAAQGASLPSSSGGGLFGSIGGFGDSIANSSVGKIASGLGGFLLDTAGQALSPAYKENLIGQNQLIRQEQLRKQGRAYSDKLYGNEATSTPYDQITQEMNPDIGMNEQPGRGFAGGQMTVAEYLTKQQSNPNKIIQTAASGMLRDRMQPGGKAQNPYSNIVTGAGGNRFGINEQGQNVKIPGAVVPQREQSPLVKINNAAEQYIKPNSEVYDKGGNRVKVPLGTPLSHGRAQGWTYGKPGGVAEIAGITAGSIRERVSKLDSIVGRDYVPGIENTMENIGLPSPIANMLRTDEGKIYNATYDTIVSDVVREASGMGVTDDEYQRRKSMLTYQWGDEMPDMEHKRWLLMELTKTMDMKSGKAMDDFWDNLDTMKKPDKKTETKKDNPPWTPDLGPVKGVYW